jgi:hypothetical protein
MKEEFHSEIRALLAELYPTYVGTVEVGYSPLSGTLNAYVRPSGLCSDDYIRGLQNALTFFLGKGKGRIH